MKNIIFLKFNKCIFLADGTLNNDAWTSLSSYQWSNLQQRYGENILHDEEGRFFFFYFGRKFTHPLPFVDIRIVSFDEREILMPIVTADSHKTIAEGTHSNGLPTDAHRLHHCPRIGFRVIPDEQFNVCRKDSSKLRREGTKTKKQAK